MAQTSKILIADDNQANRELLEAYLATVDCDIEIAVDGQAADGVLDISATLSADEKRVALFVVNPSTEPQTRRLDLSAFSPAGDAECWTVADSQKAGDASLQGRRHRRCGKPGRPGMAVAGAGASVFSIFAFWRNCEMRSPCAFCTTNRAT